jgi:hypothetical protein
MEQDPAFFDLVREAGRIQHPCNEFIPADIGRIDRYPARLLNPPLIMATEKQRAAARKNIKKAAAAARKKKTIAHLPKKTRTALGKQGAKVAAQKRSR